MNFPASRDGEPRWKASTTSSIGNSRPARIKPVHGLRDLVASRLRQQTWEAAPVSELRPAFGAGEHRLTSEQTDGLADLLIAMGALNHNVGVVERAEHLASSPTPRAAGRHLGCPSRLSTSLQWRW